MCSLHLRRHCSKGYSVLLIFVQLHSSSGLKLPFRGRQPVFCVLAPSDRAGNLQVRESNRLKSLLCTVGAVSDKVALQQQQPGLVCVRRLYRGRISKVQGAKRTIALSLCERRSRFCSLKVRFVQASSSPLVLMQHGGGSRTRKHGLHAGQVPSPGWVAGSRQRVDARDLEACIEMGIVSWIDLKLGFIESCCRTVASSQR